MKIAQTGYARPVELTGPIPERVTSDLEELKLRLFDMRPEELPLDQAVAISREISAIRLHLKRLALEREHLHP
jgi:hypothetical protein